jgi:tetratricopeptide (TPR) repeat protein
MIALYKLLELKLQRFLRWPYTLNGAAIVAACSMLCVSILPWLKDPLGAVYSAWQLPLYPGWPYHIAFLNYGLLCVLCALYTFIHAFVGGQSYRRHNYFTYGCRITRFISVIPVLLFLFQYLCTNVSALALLARHERQMLLIQMYFGYKGDNQIIMLNPFILNVSMLWKKLQLFLNCLSYGPLVLCALAWLLPAYRHSIIPLVHSAGPGYKRKLAIIWGIAILVVLFGRVPLGMACEYVAKEELSVGNYNLALVLLNSAHFLNPELEQVAYYHIEQGQAQYFLSSARLTTDSRIYLAATARAQGDYLDAYQQLLAVWHTYPTAPWLVDEMDSTLEHLIEARRPLRGSIPSRISADEGALPWLRALLKVDPANSYALYVTGRIQYDLHNYQMCIVYMSALLQTDPKDNIRSSVYTYLALSEARSGNNVLARLLLFKAISLDPDYHNNTAREELSGLH